MYFNRRFNPPIMCIGNVRIPSTTMGKYNHIFMSELLKQLMRIGIMANINQTIDYETAATVATGFGYEVHLRSQLAQKEERKKLRMLLKEFRLTVKGLLGFSKAIITSGGINLKEVDPKTMRSKIVSNLYFAGEVLDLDGPTGGYNLQVCWSTGYVAGENAAGK